MMLTFIYKINNILTSGMHRFCIVFWAEGDDFYFYDNLSFTDLLNMLIFGRVYDSCITVNFTFANSYLVILQVV